MKNNQQAGLFNFIYDDMGEAHKLYDAFYTLLKQAQTEEEKLSLANSLMNSSQYNGVMSYWAKIKTHAYEVRKDEERLDVKIEVVERELSKFEEKLRCVMDRESLIIDKSIKNVRTLNIPDYVLQSATDFLRNIEKQRVFTISFMEDMKRDLGLLKNLGVPNIKNAFRKKSGGSLMILLFELKLAIDYTKEKNNVRGHLRVIK